MLIVTTNDVPGATVTHVLGEVMGVSVRALRIGASFTAGFRAMGGGEMKEYSALMHEGRQEVIARMVAEAEARGANAILAMRIDASSIAENFTEFAAYGTAVVIQ